MKTVLAIAFAVAALPAWAGASFHEAAQPTLPAHPAMYSFADLYRLTVGGAPARGWAPPDSDFYDTPVRVVATQPAPAPDTQFAVVGIPEPRGWVLLAAGLALAGWVARRRLGYSF
jgi:hypothetical protein